MLGVHAHNSGVVHHLREDHDGIRCLHDLMEVVVKVVWQNGRSRGGSKTQKAALGKRTAFGIVISARSFLQSWIAALRRVRCPARGCEELLQEAIAAGH